LCLRLGVAGWKSVEEIVAYQLGVELRDMLLADLDSGTIPHNFRFYNQMSDAARSVPANISEGFDLYAHGRFGFHVGVAKGSLGELKTHIGEARTRGFYSEDQFTLRMTLLERTKKTTSGLLRHLKTTDAPEPWST